MLCRCFYYRRPLLKVDTFGVNIHKFYKYMIKFGIQCALQHAPEIV